MEDLKESWTYLENQTKMKNNFQFCRLSRWIMDLKRLKGFMSLGFRWYKWFISGFTLTLSPMGPFQTCLKPYISSLAQEKNSLDFPNSLYKLLKDLTDVNDQTFVEI